MKTIGFGGTLYTLWDVHSERVQVSEGEHYNQVTCIYHKNLSKVLSEAIKKAGTSHIDENLKGKRRSFEYKTPIVLEPKIMTECEKLFRIILVNDRENLVEGIRQQAFERSLELGYLTEINQYHEFNSYVDGSLRTFDKMYKWNHKLRNEDEWYSGTLDKMFIGII